MRLCRAASTAADCDSGASHRPRCSSGGADTTRYATCNASGYGASHDNDSAASNHNNDTTTDDDDDNSSTDDDDIASSDHNNAATVGNTNDRLGRLRRADD